MTSLDEPALCALEVATLTVTSGGFMPEEDGVWECRLCGTVMHADPGATPRALCSACMGERALGLAEGVLLLARTLREERARALAAGRDPEGG